METLREKKTPGELSTLDLLFPQERVKHGQRWILKLALALWSFLCLQKPTPNLDVPGEGMW